MPVVLGIDAAWTLKQPSGVALVSKDDTVWRLVAASPSYQHFYIQAVGGQRMEGRPLTGIVVFKVDYSHVQEPNVSG